MSLWMIAWRGIQHRGLASTLTALSMALGVMLVVSVLTIHGVVADSFRANAELGYNMILGAKGGSLQLTLNSVYYLSRPIENVPYDYYLEFAKPPARAEGWRHSCARQLAEAAREHAELHALAAGLPALEPTLWAAAAHQQAAWQAAAEREFPAEGRYGKFVELAIPIALGDYLGPFRVVGTSPAMFDELPRKLEKKRIEFAQGRNLQSYSEEHGYFEAVLGAVVAREMNLGVGQSFSPSHGDPTGKGHGEGFQVVGVLRPSGSPYDRAVFVNIEGFLLMEGHPKPLPDAKAPAEFAGVFDGTPAPPTIAPEELARLPLPLEQREATAVLLRSPHLLAGSLQNRVNEGQTAQIVFPVQEIYSLLTMFVAPIQRALLLLTFLLCVVSGVSILVSIYNSMSERRREIAIMRALGADRFTVMGVILAESVMLGAGGGAAGWLLGHMLNLIANPWVEEYTGVTVGLFSFTLAELYLIPIILLLAVAAGLLPALAAYRTDVAKSLGK